MYFSDHGDMHGSQGKFAKMLPYAESINIPFLVGGHVPRGQNKTGERDVPLNHIDIAPTTLGLCGIGTIIDLVNIKRIATDYNQKKAVETIGKLKWMNQKGF